MAILTAIVQANSRKYQELHIELHVIGRFVDTKSQYGDGKALERDDLHGFIKKKVQEYKDLLKKDDGKLGTDYYGELHDYLIYDTRVERGVNDITGRLGFRERLYSIRATALSNRWHKRSNKNIKTTKE